MSEDQAHQLRVSVWKQRIKPVNFSNDPREAEALSWIRSNYGHAGSIMMLKESEIIGEEKAQELWEKARIQAEKELKEKLGKLVL
jgi:hypothetical protein